MALSLLVCAANITDWRLRRLRIIMPPAREDDR
jgi:hypothetical protein